MVDSSEIVFILIFFFLAIYYSTHDISLGCLACSCERIRRACCDWNSLYSMAQKQLKNSFAVVYSVPSCQTLNRITNVQLAFLFRTSTTLCNFQNFSVSFSLTRLIYLILLFRHIFTVMHYSFSTLIYFSDMHNDYQNLSVSQTITLSLWLPFSFHLVWAPHFCKHMIYLGSGFDKWSVVAKFYVLIKCKKNYDMLSTI